jgi:division protein CdvB (Snf7/Vps24/ESCRT-III family)
MTILKEVSEKMYDLIKSKGVQMDKNLQNEIRKILDEYGKLYMQKHSAKEPLKVKDVEIQEGDNDTYIKGKNK